MREFLQSKAKLKKALKIIKSKEKKEGVNVCKAIDGIYDNGVEAGKRMMQEKVQEAEEKVQEAEKKVQKAAINLLEKMAVTEVAELLSLDVEIVKRLK